MLNPLLHLVNGMFAQPRIVKGMAYFCLIATTWTVIRNLSTSLGIPGGWQRLAGEVGVSLVLSLAVFFLRPLRWHFIYRSLENEVKWFNKNNASILVGVGPGGAIIAGMVAKLMAECNATEPEIAVIDRGYNQDEYNEVQVSIDKAAKRLNLQSTDVGVIVVTSEIHSGGTICEVCEELRKRNINAPVFSYLWSPGAKRKPNTKMDRFVMMTDQRGILPWPDAPAKG